MRHRWLAAVSVVSLLVAAAPAGTSGSVQGVLEEIEGQRILRLWGTHQDMGYAHGFLLAEEIVLLTDQYFIGQKWMDWTYENIIRPYVDEYFILPPDYQEELGAMFSAILASGVDTYLQSVGRNFDFLDLHAANLFGDFTKYECSSISAWGEMTFEDSTLAGGLVMARNFEYPTGPGGILPLHSLLIAYDPSSPDEKRWVSVAWPGQIGCLSGMNEDGITSATDGGRSTAPAVPEPHTLIGHFFSVRDAIENIDENGDGRETIDDVIFAIGRDPRLGALLTHVVSPFEPWQEEEPGVVVEMDSHGYALRYGMHNLLHPNPIYSNDCLVVTNSPKLYTEPLTAMGRYYAVKESLHVDLKVDTEELWRMERAISYPTTLHGIIFRPNLRDMFVAFGDSVQGAYYCSRVHWTWEDLFPR